MQPLTPTPTLEYAAPTVLQPMSPLAARRHVWASIAPAAVGFLLLAIYRLTANDVMILVGLGGAMLGGGATTTVFVLAVVNFVRAFIRRPREGSIAQLYALAVVGAICSAVIGLAGVKFAGQWYLSPHVPLSVRNATAVPIDGVTIHFGNGDLSTGPLQPGEVRALGTRWLLHSGRLDISVRVGQRVRRKTDRPDTDLFHEKGPQKRNPVEIVVEPAELPKAVP